MLKKGKNLVERKKAEKNIKEIIKVNDLFKEFLISYQGNNIETIHEDDINSFKNLNEHLSNLNVIFNQMLTAK